MRRHADRPHAGASPAMRNRKRLVQIQMANVRADRCRAGEPDLRVHVCAIHVHLTAEPVRHGADFLYRVLEHAVR